MRNTHAGKVAIVTGSARGIGAAIASQLARESARVVVNYNSGKAASNDVVGAILRDGGKALAVQADVRTAVGAERLFAVAEAELGPVDYLTPGGRNRLDAVLFKKALLDPAGSQSLPENPLLYTRRNFSLHEGPMGLMIRSS